MLLAQLAQTAARLEQVDDEIERTKLRVPFAGVVVSGDWSQSLGVPVSRGDLLFEVAPLDGYRVLTEVDERDISQIVPGQYGELVLAGLPGERFAFVVEKLTPVSTPAEGRNRFEVIGKLASASPVLRPGMEGVAKVTVETRRKLWIWTHKMQFWMRYQLWSFWP